MALGGRHDAFRQNPPDGGELVTPGKKCDQSLPGQVLAYSSWILPSASAPWSLFHFLDGEAEWFANILTSLQVAEEIGVGVDPDTLHKIVELATREGLNDG